MALAKKVITVLLEETALLKLALQENI